MTVKEKFDCGPALDVVNFIQLASEKGLTGDDTFEDSASHSDDPVKVADAFAKDMWADLNQPLPESPRLVPGHKAPNDQTLASSVLVTALPSPTGNHHHRRLTSEDSARLVSSLGRVRSGTTMSPREPGLTLQKRMSRASFLRGDYRDEVQLPKDLESSLLPPLLPLSVQSSRPTMRE
jgi:hypothetical protein